MLQAFTEGRMAELPRFTPDGIPITMENKFDDAIYNYLYEYWKTNSGEYDPKKDVIPESEMNKMHPKTKNEFQFENWLFEQYGMTKKEERGYTVKGNLESLWEIFSAADMVLFARGLPSIGKELAQLGKKAVDDVAEEAIEKTVKTEVTEEVAESTAKKEMADTAEDLSQKTVDKDNTLEKVNGFKSNFKTVEDILEGATPGRKTKGKAQQWNKSGGYEQALKDYNSLDVRDSHKIETGYGSGITGTLSDGSKVNVRPGSTQGDATVEIQKPNGVKIKIRYGDD